MDEQNGNEIKNGTTPAVLYLDADGKEHQVFYPAEQPNPWMLTVPAWAVPHVVGRGGAKAQALQAVLGVKVTVVGVGSDPCPARPKVIVNVGEVPSPVA